MKIRLKGSDFSNLRRKSPLDFLSREDLFVVLNEDDLGDGFPEQQQMITNPTVEQKILVFQWIAEAVGNKEMEKAVLEQFAEEIDKIFNE